MADLTAEKTLDWRKAKVAEALAAGLTKAAAANEAGVSESTARRYAELPEVQEAVRKAESARLVALSRKLTDASDQALDVLIAAMTDAKNSANTRIRAALGILQYRKEFYELTAVQTQLDDLEARLKGAGI